MKDTVTIKKRTVGKGLESFFFLISPTVQEALELNFSDILSVHITGLFKEGAEPFPADIHIVGKTFNSGANSKGFIIKKDVIEKSGLKEGDTVAIDVKLKELKIKTI